MSARAMFLALALALGVCSGGGQSAYPLSGPGMTDIAGGGSWDGDLGVPLVCNGSPGATWVMLGDVLGSVQHRRVPNACVRGGRRAAGTCAVCVRACTGQRGEFVTSMACVT